MMTADQVGQLVAVVGYALLCALACAVLVIVGGGPWVALGRAVWGWWQIGARRAEELAEARHRRRLESVNHIADASTMMLTSSEDARTTLGGSEGGTNQGSRTSAPPSDVISDLLPHLAAIKKPDNTYWFSANEIAAKVGGTRADVLARIREIREPEPELVQLPGDDSVQVPAYEAPPR